MPVDAWVNQAISEISADFQRSADTHMIRLPLPATPEIHVYLKDESTHPSGSLKHRLARSLFLYALCNGWIHEGTTVVEASSGSTAVSEAYFARLLGLPFVAVVPKTTSQQKVKLIEFYGGNCHFVDKAEDVVAESKRLASQPDAHFMDQFTYAERATDWRGNNNIAESLFRQLELEPHDCPAWIVVGAGTGGTSATIGRFLRYFQKPTQLCVVDPENSVFFDYFETRDKNLHCPRCPRIEGIGRQRPELSFIPSVIDRMIQVPDAMSLGAMLFLESVLGRKCGASTGTNLIGVMQLAAEMRAANVEGSIVTLLCDAGERYGNTYFDPAWRREHQLDAESEYRVVEQFFECGAWDRDALRQG